MKAVARYLSNGRLQALIAIGLFAALLFFFSQSRQTGQDAFGSATARIDEFENLWMRMSASMYPLMFEIQMDFDDLARAEGALRESLAALEASPFTPETTRLTELMNQSLILVEDFKSEQAIFRNSRSIVAQTFAELRQQPFANAETTLDDLSTLEKSFLDYVGRRDPASVQALAGTIEDISTENAELTEAPLWSVLHPHIENAVATADRLTNLFVAMSLVPIPLALAEQHDALETQLRYSSTIAARYQAGLLIIAVLLLSFGALKATQVSRYVHMLNRANDELDTRVKERTLELLEANETLSREIEERRRAEEQVAHSESLLREARQIARIGNWVWDLAAEEHHWSEELYSMLEITPQADGNPFDVLLSRMHPDDERLFLDSAQASWKDGSPIDLDLRIATPDRSEAVFHCTGITTFQAEGRPLRMLGTLQDVTQRRRTESALQDSEGRYSTTIKLAPVGISQVSLQGRFTHVNPQLCDMLGYRAEELLALSPKEISHPDDVHAADAELMKLARGEIDSFEVEKRYLSKAGTEVWVKLIVTARRDTNGNALDFISIVDDISSRRRAESRVRYLATHDEMTGLPNRARFCELVRQAAASAKRNGNRCAVFFMDLDRFKDINDTLGHQAGDELLQVVSSRLKGVLRESDYAARLGGDEFCLLLDNVSDSHGAAVVAQKCLQIIAEPVRLAGRELEPRASIGISLFPDHGDDHETLMKNADSAMYAAKQSEHQRYAFYTAELTIAAERRMTLEHDLRRSVERGEFELHYQPQISLRTGRIESVEALVRWKHPIQGLIGPNEFIDVAEKIGLIEDLGEWVLRTACTQAATWNLTLENPIRVAVNVSSRHIRDGKIVDSVDAVLRDTGLEHDLLEIEITEDAIQTGDDVVETFTRLRDLGVHIAVDDFGTGYSWLDSLRRLPINTLKIDKRFVHELTERSEVAAIVATIFAMGRAMNTTVIAEGVETAEQVRHLRALGCTKAQGYFFSRPVPEGQIAELTSLERYASARVVNS